MTTPEVIGLTKNKLRKKGNRTASNSITEVAASYSKAKSIVRKLYQSDPVKYTKEEAVAYNYEKAI